MTLVHLNLRPGTADAVTICESVAGAVRVEAYVMAPLTEGPYAMVGEPAIWSEFTSVLAACGSAVELAPVERSAIYALVTTDEVALVVASADVAVPGARVRLERSNLEGRHQWR